MKKGWNDGPLFHRVYRTFTVSLFFLLASVSAGRACGVCFTEDGYLVRWMYYSTTASLILLPALMIAGFVYWIRRQDSGPSAERS